MQASKKRIRAILQALLVTFLWSTSWVLIKITLQDIPPLTFAGLRYTLAAILLLPGLLKQKAQLKALTKKNWLQLILLGWVFYTLAQGGMFLALNQLEAVTLSLLLNFSALLVAILSVLFQKEVPTGRQWLGIAVFIGGVMVYFYPYVSVKGQYLGLVLALIPIVSNAFGTLMGRAVNREKLASPLVVTGVSMAVGAVTMLSLGLAVEGIPRLSLVNIAVILWLGVVNTAFAFTLWNHVLQVLTAVEASLINNTMLIQIAVLAWIFLNEDPTLLDILGLILAAVGVTLAHIKKGDNFVQQVDKKNNP
jgi:drug/metabolite transporter (DMT)-like permease